MSVLQWGRGFEAAETMSGTVKGCREFRGFNGAAVLRPRKRENRDGTRSHESALQWGRGFEAAETRVVGQLSPIAVRLQWGRGFEAAETS